MNPRRRIAAAVTTALVSLGAIAVSAGPVQASRDTTWPRPVTSDTQSRTTSTATDTTWPKVTDTTWPKSADTTWPRGADTTWPKG